MKKVVYVSLMYVLFTSLVFSQQATQDFVAGHLYIKIKNDIPLNMSLNSNEASVDLDAYTFLSTISKRYQVKKVTRPFYAAKESSTLQHTMEMELVNDSDVMPIMQELYTNKAIEYVERVPLNRTAVVPNDPAYNAQWELVKINAAGAWNYSTGSSSVVVAVVDEGVDLTHPDLAANIWVNPGEIAGNGIDDDGNGYVDDINGYDIANNDNNPSPPGAAYTHGTEVAGFASAVTNNAKGMASIGYSIKIMAVQCATSPGGLAYGYSGIVYAATAGAKVINLSWGGGVPTTTGQNVIDYAHSKGCIIIAAAGNSNVSTPVYPAAYNYVIAVASTGSGDAKSYFSNYGSYIDLSAPGENVYTTALGGGYTTNSGTSFSSPIVAGLCGLMLSLNPNLSADDIETCLKNNADNIDAQNSSYVGQLGAGRINAANSMACVQATLLLKPIPDFVSNFTTVSAGGKVIFTNLTTQNATSWNWTFNGGTPSSYVGKTPPQITYNTPGTYDVTLVAGNANGSNTITKTGYITVVAAGGCAGINYGYASSGTWTATLYYADIKLPIDTGYIVGLNGLDKDVAKAQYYDGSATPYDKLTRVWISVARAYSSNPNKIITINVYDGTSGSPGALLGSATRTIQQFRNAQLALKLLDVPFRPVISLPVSKKFFISIDYSTLSTTAGDTLAIVTNKQGQSNPSGIWEKYGPNGNWYHFASGGQWPLYASMYMFPLITNQPVVATSTVSPTTICQGGTINVDATGSTFQDTLLWFNPGGLPDLSNAVSTTVLYNTPGTYIAKLYVVGGGCHELDSTVNVITVNPTPAISISSSKGTKICSGASTVLTASGAAGSYSWTPATNLDVTSGPVVNASPTANITYNVSGSTAGCVGNAAINIQVDGLVNVNVSATPSSLSVCENANVTFDATASTNVGTYSWSFPGGTPSSSTLATPAVAYASAGTYTVTLTASNTCGSNTSYQPVVNVSVCTGLKKLLSESDVLTYYNPLEKTLSITVNQNLNSTENISVGIVDMLGRIIYSGQLQQNAGQSVSVIDMSDFSSGLYTLRLADKSTTFNRKFIAQ